jgi:hypothetical protein
MRALHGRNIARKIKDIRGAMTRSIAMSAVTVPLIAGSR